MPGWTPGWRDIKNYSAAIVKTLQIRVLMDMMFCSFYSFHVTFLL
ncbi:unnamed protein product [Cuscuta epithymum]|uniref:Uncharacterized protein n=1 Tax=Cuscuta epithymum TaxID=186058 RepID=A0AAV0G9I9_9ASTE|nr:unnamed protein product [Cuscuta epithymum]